MADWEQAVWLRMPGFAIITCTISLALLLFNKYDSYRIIHCKSFWGTTLTVIVTEEMPHKMIPAWYRISTWGSHDLILLTQLAAVPMSSMLSFVQVLSWPKVAPLKDQTFVNLVSLVQRLSFSAVLDALDLSSCHRHPSFRFKFNAANIKMYFYFDWLLTHQQTFINFLLENR